MASGFVVRKNEYYDSVFLMRVAKGFNDEPGVQESAVLMATESNKKLLAKIGIFGDAVAQAGPNDLVVAVVSASPAVVQQMLSTIDQRLQSFSANANPKSFPSIDEAALSNTRSNLTVISIPGEYAAREARKALEHGKHVFLFSSNVPLEEEIKLKQFAQSRGLLVMGPDCGTSIISGSGIGFANKVRSGSIGVVGASGTGLQEFTSLIHHAGAGISHAIGTGSRDLTDAVGGITTLAGFDALDADPATKAIAIVTKPAQPETLAHLLERIRTSSKPVVGCFLGMQNTIQAGRQFSQAQTIDDAVQLILQGIGQKPHASNNESAASGTVAREVLSWLPGQRYLRGLFAGGTFCYQSQQILSQAGIPVYSNSPLDKRYHLGNSETSLEHCLIDMGDENYTQGRPHPMIDSEQRCKRIAGEAVDPEVAILLLDFILGYVASADPAGDLLDAIRQAKKAAARRGGNLTVVASICGTDLDPQGFTQQRQRLQGEGVITFSSNAQAARFCMNLIQYKGMKNG